MAAKEIFTAPVDGIYEINTDGIKKSRPKKDASGNDILIGYHHNYIGYEKE